MKAVKILQESEERYRTILENVEDGYYEVDLNGNYLFCNEAFARILGYGPQELIGLNFREFSSRETADSVYRSFHDGFSNRLASQNPGRGNASVRMVPSGWSSFRAFPIKNGEGMTTGFKGTTRDVTERKRPKWPARIRGEIPTKVVELSHWVASVPW